MSTPLHSLPQQPTAAPIATTPQQNFAVSPEFAETVNSRRKKALDVTRVNTEAGKMLAKLAAQKPGEIAYLRGSKEGLFRSALGTLEKPYALFTHCEKGGDELLGDGSYKSVKLCVNLRTAEIRAVAIFRKINPKTKQPVSAYDLSLAKREAEIMERCNNIPEVVRLDFSKETDEFIFFVMELCKEGDLFGMLQIACESEKNRLSVRSRFNIALDLARALEKLHEREILHRDIKNENVFLFRTPGGFHAKIGDFGFACDQSDEESRLKAVGSPHWLSRKSARLLVKNSFGKDRAATLAMKTTQDDMDPLGYILYQLFHGSHSCLPMQAIEDQKQSITAIAKLSDAELQKCLHSLHRPYRRVLKGIFFKNWTAKDVRIALENIQSSLATPSGPSASAPAPGAAAPAPTAPAPAITHPPAHQSSAGCGPDDNPMALAVPTPAAPALVPSPPPARQSPVAALHDNPMALAVPTPAAPAPLPQASVG